MRLVALFVVASFVLATANANAVFFFFLPGFVTSKIGDALTGAEGENCVKSTAKIGDKLKSASGNTATIKSLSGTSSRCPDASLPIRAMLTFDFDFSSKAGMDIPDGWEQKPLTDIQRFEGNLLRAENTAQRTGVFVSARGRDSTTDTVAIAQGIANRMISTLEEGKTQNEEQLQINGLKAYRFEVDGKSKGLFHPKFTYVVTLLEAQNELVILNAWSGTGDFAKNKETLQQLAFRIAGVKGTEPQAPLASSEREITVTKQAPDGSIAVEKTGDSTTPPNAVIPSQPPSTATSIPDKLRELDKLFKDGVITQVEYETKKKELLAALWCCPKITSSRSSISTYVQRLRSRPA